MELLVLRVLKWDLSVVTPHDFLDQILGRLSIKESDYNTMRSHSQVLVTLSAIDFEFAQFSPSVIASGSVTVAAESLLGPEWCQHAGLIDKIRTITSTDPDSLQRCKELIYTMQQ
jgi:cyclin D2